MTTRTTINGTTSASRSSLRTGSRSGLNHKSVELCYSTDWQPRSQRMEMATFTRRQFNQTLMAAIGTGWHPDVLGARSYQGMQQPTAAGCITDVPGIKAGHWTDT